MSSNMKNKLERRQHYERESSNDKHTSRRSKHKREVSEGSSDEENRKKSKRNESSRSDDKKTKKMISEESSPDYRDKKHHKSSSSIQRSKKSYDEGRLSDEENRKKSKRHINSSPDDNDKKNRQLISEESSPDFREKRHKLSSSIQRSRKSFHQESLSDEENGKKSRHRNDYDGKNRQQISEESSPDSREKRHYKLSSSIQRRGKSFHRESCSDEENGKKSPHRNDDDKNRQQISEESSPDPREKRHYKLSSSIQRREKSFHREHLSDEENRKKSRDKNDHDEKNRQQISEESSPDYREKRHHKLKSSIQRSEKSFNEDREVQRDSTKNTYQKDLRNSSDEELDKYRRRVEPRLERKEDQEYKNKRIAEEADKEPKDDSEQNESMEPLSKRQKIVNINMRTGGAYIPPARLRMMQDQIKDKGSEEYQRIAWEALKKSIIGMTNKINSSNITEIIPELFRENIIRGRGVLSRAIMQAQAASPTFTRVYASLVAIINTKFPEIGELILKRLIVQYKRGFRRNDKTICMTAVRFLAHLLNQEVAHEILILEIVTHLLENPSEDSVEVAIACLKECGKKLTQLTPRGMRAIIERVRNVLHEANMDVRVRYMIEVFFAIQKDGFKDFEIMPKELDLVEEDDKYTHLINLDDAVDAQEMLNIFKFDPDYLENEEKYKSVVKEILGEESEEGSDGESGSEEEEQDDEEKNEESQQIIDMTETNLVCLRRKIYLTVQSSLDFEECAHKLLKLDLKPGQVLEMCYMILDCCAQQRTYEKFYGLLAQRFCQLSKIYVEPFTEIFENSYYTIHRLETNKLRNVAKFFAHLLYTDAISWMVLKIIKLNEDDTTSSSRIFIKILFQELCEYMGLPKLNNRIKDVTLQEAFDGLFPRDHPKNTRFAVNFFTSIGLGGLTDELREHLKNLPKNPILPPQNDADSSEEEEDSSSSSPSSSSDSSSSTSSSSDSESEKLSRRKQVQKRRRK